VSDTVRHMGSFRPVADERLRGSAKGRMRSCLGSDYSSGGARGADRDEWYPRQAVPSTGRRGPPATGHGGAKSKDSNRFVGLSRLYAESTGLAVVCIDAVDHGERRPVVAGGPLPAEWHSNAIGPMVSDWVETAKAFSWIGPPVAYVGFSMGAIFGVPTVGSLASIKAAVFVVGGIPAGGEYKTLLFVPFS